MSVAKPHGERQRPGLQAEGEAQRGEVAWFKPSACAWTDSEGNALGSGLAEGLTAREDVRTQTDKSGIIFIGLVGASECGFGLCWLRSASSFNPGHRRGLALCSQPQLAVTGSFRVVMGHWAICSSGAGRPATGQHGWTGLSLRGR